MNINPGELNRRIEIVRPGAISKNENGFPVRSDDVVIRRPWAKVTRTSGSETIKANSEFSVSKQRFLIRYTDDPIDTDCYIRFHGHAYDIEFLNDYNDRHEYLEVWCSLKERV